MNPSLKKNNNKRLNKVIANNRNCSRKEADLLIKKGIITVNGNIVLEMGIKVTQKDIIKLNSIKLNYFKLRYILLNKPKKHIDSQIKSIYEEKIVAIDELQTTETGLSLLTNDKEIIAKFNKLKKIYHIILNKDLKKEDFNHFKKTKIIDHIAYIKGKEKYEIGIENTFGCAKEIKEMFSKMKYSIIKLDRVYIGGLTKKDLPRGQYRSLSDSEINILKRI